MRSLEQANWKGSCAPPASRLQQRQALSSFLTPHHLGLKETTANSRDASRASLGTAPLLIFPTTFTTRQHRVFWRHRGTRPISKSRKVVIIRAAFASFRNCVENFVLADLSL